MSMVIAPFQSAAPYGAVGPIAMAYRNSDASFGDSVAITFNVEGYDSETAFAATSANFTVASAGIYRQSQAAMLNTNYIAFKARKNGSVVQGGVGSTCEVNVPRWHSGGSAPLTLAASDVFSVMNQFATATYVSGYTWFAVERLPADLKYAVVRKSADQTSVTSAAVSFNTEDADTHGFHDTVTNNERLTVPSGITRVRVSGNIVTGSYNGQAELVMRKNGSSDVVGVPSERVSGTGNKLINLFSPPINVSPGDYFDLLATLASSSSILAEQFTWFAIEEVHPSIKSCLVYNSTGHSLTTTDVALGWDSEDHDPEGMHSTSSNTSRLVVPSGCTWARPSFQLKGALNSTLVIQAQTGHTGSGVGGPAIDSRNGVSGAYQRLHGVGSWTQVSPGDYFELIVRVPTGSLTTTGGWFALECM